MQVENYFILRNIDFWYVSNIWIVEGFPLTAKPADHQERV